MSVYKSILFTLIAALSGGLAQSDAASLPFAAASNDAPSADASGAGMAAEKLQAAQARLARMQRIADRFSAEAAALGFQGNAWRFELINRLMRADQATVGRVEAAADLRSALQTAAAPSAAGPQPQSLGQTTNDLIYVPIAPCRIVDTRNSGAGGNFAAGESRTYAYAGGAAQGGATCTFTAGTTPAALAVNVTVVSSGLGNNPAAFGFLSVYPEGGSPTSSWLNYLGSDTKANAGIAAINQASGKFSVYTQNPTHVIVDLFGVFRAATDGTPNFVAKWDGAGTLGTSSIRDDGAHVHIGLGTVRNNLVEIGGVANNYSDNALVIGNGVQGMSFAQTGVSEWLTDTDFALMPAFAGNGRLGIGTTTPTHIVDIFGVNPQIQLEASQNGATATLSRYTNRLEISPSDAFQVSVGALASPDLVVAGNHKVGIGTGAPVNRLQIGSLGGSNYNGNDIAFGDGTQASGIAQTANYVHWYSTANIALMPGNGNGRVGINTTTPHVPLEVDGHVGIGPETYGYFNSVSNNLNTCDSCTADVSILASNNVMALEFDAESDARIKDIAGPSDKAKDLDTLNAIEVTDYTLKDKVRNGNKPFKKVIAQQVEAIYPQVVSRHTDFIPNVYRSADTIEKTGAGYTLRFATAHGLSGTAKHVRLLVEGDTAMRKVDVLAIPSEREVSVDAQNLDGRKVFVFGEEVDDFRSVDYEGLTALNISATQELARRLQRQQAEADATARAKDAQIAALRAELAAQAARIDALQNLAAEVAAIKAKASAAEPIVAYAAPAKP